MTPLPRQSLILFDLDGTLVDSRQDLATAVNLTRADYGLPALPVEVVAGFVGDGIRVLVERAFAGEPIAVEAAVPALRAHYAAHLVDQTRPYPGVVEALERLGTAGFALAMATNKPVREAIAICKALALADRLTVIFGDGSPGRLKPEPDRPLAALAASGCQAEASWVVGDNWTDLEAGRRAGMKCCFCRYGFGRRRGRPADLEINDLRELAAFLGA
ncbi:MAG: Phosphoglycolate phosphatase [Lentisphaerae bacterium ADurb.BinA184]|nr:MAG: Phosphoglycolate phosphatase [Lentisphaerae bacterium ADurb.BinA184]